MKNEESSAIYLTAHVFGILLDQIIDHFKKKHRAFSHNSISQLYGFGNYDESRPNLRTELEQLEGEFVNGKYLYEKSRELKSGNPSIKLNGYYKKVFFKYLGHQDLAAFIDETIEDKGELKRQRGLIQKEDQDKTYYYVSYHFGENKEVIKSQVTILNGWRNAKYKYIYPQADGSIKEFFYRGRIIKNNDIIHIKTQTEYGGKLIDGGEDMLYIGHMGHSEPKSSPFLLGTYSAFDIYNKVVAGKLVFELCKSKEDMVEKSLSKTCPPHIVQEIRNKRFTNTGVVPNDVFEISSNSPFSSTYGKIPGIYNCSFFQGESQIGNFDFGIDKYTYKTKAVSQEILIEEDAFELINRGSVIQFSFRLTGIALFSNLEVFLKTYYLNSNEKVIKGVFSGIDFENRLIHGEVEIEYTAA